MTPTRETVCVSQPLAESCVTPALRPITEFTLSTEFAVLVIVVKHLSRPSVTWKLVSVDANLALVVYIVKLVKLATGTIQRLDVNVRYHLDYSPCMLSDYSLFRRVQLYEEVLHGRRV